MSASCALEDCGDPSCRVCYWGRQPQPKKHADLQQRDQATLKEAKVKPRKRGWAKVGE